MLSVAPQTDSRNNSRVMIKVENQANFIYKTQMDRHAVDAMSAEQNNKITNFQT